MICSLHVTVFVLLSLMKGAYQGRVSKDSCFFSVRKIHPERLSMRNESLTGLYRPMASLASNTGSSAHCSDAYSSMYTFTVSPSSQSVLPGRNMWLGVTVYTAFLCTHGTVVKGRDCTGGLGKPDPDEHGLHRREYAMSGNGNIRQNGAD